MSWALFFFLECKENNKMGAARKVILQFAAKLNFQPFKRKVEVDKLCYSGFTADLHL